jgi:hypothetical protein
MLGRVEGKACKKTWERKKIHERGSGPRLPDGGSGSFLLQRSNVKIRGQDENILPLGISMFMYDITISNMRTPMTPAFCTSVEE